jgi:ABC-type phosphate/phosphonate transport system substrate-binding protein
MYRLSYYPWLTQNIPQETILAQIKIFAREIESQLQRLGQENPQVQVLPSLDVPEQIDQIVAKGADIALMNPLGFVFARRRTGDVEAVAVAQRMIDGKKGIVYFAQLYTHKKTAIRNLAGAAGRSIGFGISYSTSNFLVPAAMLKEAGVHPLAGFGRIEFLKGHEIVARAVYEGKVDVGAGHDGVLIDLARQPGYGDASEVLIQLARSQPIPSDPVVVSVQNPAERDLLKAAIVAAGGTAIGIAALKIFWGDTQGLEATTSDFYQSLNDALQALKFEEADLLPRKRKP